MFGAILLVLITILFPPIGVLIVAGINVCLTLLGYIPGHVHAFYVEYVYYSRREAILAVQAGEGSAEPLLAEPAAGVYSQRVQNGGVEGYGSIA